MSETSIEDIRGLKENIEMSSISTGSPILRITREIYDSGEEYDNGSLCTWRAPSLFRSDTRDSRVHSGILFTLSIHTRGTFAVYRRDPRAHSEKDGRTVRLVHSGESVTAFNYMMLEQKKTETKKNRFRNKII